MIQWFEKLINKDDGKLNDDNLVALETEFNQLKNQVLQLSNLLNQGKFGETELGKEALNSLSQLYNRLSENQNHPEQFNTDRLRQEKQNFQSFWKIYTLEVNTQLSSLRKSITSQRTHGLYLKEIDRALSRINKLLDQINDFEFPELCNQFGVVVQFCNKLKVKIEEKKKNPDAPVQKIVVTSVNSEQQEQVRKKEEAKSRLLEKLNEFRKSLDFSIAHLDSSPFKSTIAGIDTLGVLNGLKKRLLNENINLETFDDSMLEQEKQGLQNFLALESKELKKQLRECISDLRIKRARGFHTSEIDNWIKEADNLINQEGLRFLFLCDEYAKLYQSHSELKLKISESAQQEYSTYLKKIAELQIGHKCQTVQNSSFLAEYEKDQFLKLAESVQAEFKLITLENIKSSDAEKRIVLSNLEVTYDSLLGKGSLAQQRSQFCSRFHSSLDNECNILSEETKSLFTLCVKQNLLSGGEDSLSTLQDGKKPHALVRLFQIIRQTDITRI